MYTREEILSAFQKWFEETPNAQAPATDPEFCTETLVNYMEAARQADPL
jgi:hypothetical protein